MAARMSSELGLKTRGKVGQIRGAGESGQMQNLLGEFKGLYEGRLKKLEEAEQQGDDTLRVLILIMLKNVSEFWRLKISMQYYRYMWKIYLPSQCVHPVVCPALLPLK